VELKNCNNSKGINTIILYHQNIRSVTNKIDELSIHLQTNGISPHFICLTEHHLKETEITNFAIEGYEVASRFCRKESLGGGVCILINKKLSYFAVDLNQYCQEKTIEICALKLQFKSLKLMIFCVYRAPTGNLNLFFNQLEYILSSLVQPNVTFLICGDLNINLLTKSNAASKLLTLMNTHNLTQVVDFPTRRTNNEGTLTDTIFLGTTAYDQIQTKPFINGLSDHDAQIICLHKINLISQQNFLKRKSRVINDDTICYFKSLLEEETWNHIFSGSCVNEILINFMILS
jgi:exonuclease III